MIETNSILFECKAGGFKFDNVKMYVMTSVCEYVQNFETLYEKILVNTIEKAYLMNHEAKSYNLTHVYDKTLEQLDMELDRQYIRFQEVQKRNININSILDDLEKAAENINEKILNKYKCKIFTNSIYGLHYKNGFSTGV